MARALRVQFPGAIYHVTARGNERREIFRDDQDRERFLDLLGGQVKARHARLYAYVLMANHYHLLLETPRANLTAFMQQLNGAYSVYFNRRHRRIGHLLAGRYKARLVEGDAYLDKLTRYIHLNPVMITTQRNRPPAERVKVLRAYRWSTYRGYAGMGVREKWVEYGPLRAMRAAKAGREPEAYRRFVEAGLAETDAEMREALGRSSKAIGRVPFCRWAEEAYRKLARRQGQPLDVAMRRMETPEDPERILKAVCAHYGATEESLRQRRGMAEARIMAMHLLKQECGLSQRLIAERLGLRDGSGISRHLARVAKAGRPWTRRYETILRTAP